MERAFLVREGMGRKDDRLIRKWATKPVPNGPYQDKSIDEKKWEGMLYEYYELRGWNKDGVPTREKLIELGLNDVADQLHLK